MSEYLAPPVHEVILELRFRSPVGDDSIERVPQLIGPCERVLSNEFHLGLDGTARVSAGKFEHWLRREIEDCMWTVRVSREAVTLNSVRPGPWPVGLYVGWTRISAYWSQLVKQLQGTFTEPAQRAGVRYINKVDLPLGSNLTDWLNVSLSAPKIFDGVTNFRLKQSWESVKGFDGLSASYSSAVVAPEESPRPDRLGVAIDIDVFNRPDVKLPDLKNIIPWFEQAHAAENVVFEACITDRLRAALGLKMEQRT